MDLQTKMSKYQRQVDHLKRWNGSRLPRDATAMAVLRKWCKKPGHVRAQSGQSKSRVINRREKLWCHICGWCSHEIEYCRNPVRKHKDKESSAHAVAIENPDVDAAGVFNSVSESDHISGLVTQHQEDAEIDEFGKEEDVYDEVQQLPDALNDFDDDDEYGWAVIVLSGALESVAVAAVSMCIVG
jgi:hypothetical protein